VAICSAAGPRRETPKFFGVRRELIEVLPPKVAPRVKDAEGVNTGVALMDT